MRVVIKSIIYYLKVGPLVRKLRKYFYSIFDFLGYTVFFILRFLLFLPKTKEFNKDSIKKILIIRLDRIGDLILSTPAIRAIRSTFSKAEIHLLVKEYTKELVVNNPNIDKLVIYEKDKLKNNYDLAVAFHPGLRQNFCTFKSGSKIRIGYTGQGGGFFLTHKIEDDRAKRIRHEVESALEVVGLVGCKTEDSKLEISITKEGEKFVEDFFEKNSLFLEDLIIAVHPGARQAYIRWEKEGFAEAVVVTRTLNFYQSMLGKQ